MAATVKGNADAAAKDLSAIFERMEIPINVRELPDRGKGVYALKPLAPGTILFEERPLIAWMFANQYTRASVLGSEAAAAAPAPSEGAARPPAPIKVEFGGAEIVEFAPFERCRVCLREIIPAAVPKSKTSAAPTSAEVTNDRFCLEGSCRQSAAYRCISEYYPVEVESALRRFHLQNYGRDGEEDTPITVESLALGIANIVSKYVRVAASSAGLPPNEAPSTYDLFHAAAATFERFVQPPDDAAFNGVDSQSWFGELRRVYQPFLTSLGRTVKKNEIVPLPMEVIEAMFMDATLTTMLGQLALNSQALNIAKTTTTATSSSTSASASSLIHQEGENVQMVPSRVSAGAGIYVLQSNFNHSCEPNCVIMFGQDAEITLAVKGRGVQDELDANIDTVMGRGNGGSNNNNGNSGHRSGKDSKGIMPNEELTISYISALHLAFENVTKRREMLAPYLFECNCRRCSEEAAKLQSTPVHADAAAL